MLEDVCIEGGAVSGVGTIPIGDLCIIGDDETVGDAGLLGDPVGFLPASKDGFVC